MPSRRAIRVLDDLSIARIAAGEVVERPASVVKELVENALDAGAHRIEVRIEGGGLRRIEVEDDGGGIAAAEVALAFTRHATSKIDSADDLESVASLGFRGEALASIAAVSHVTVVTRVPDDALGVRLRIDNGRLLGQEPTTAAAGTRLVVENLFNALPARLKFQKSEATEAGRVGEWLGRLAFAHPDVAFTLSRAQRTTLRTRGDGDRRAVLAAVLGDDVAETLLEVDHQADGIRVAGLAGPPHVQRANRGGIALFAGGRWIQSPRLTHAVVEAYHALIPSGRYPVAWLLIDVPPETIDVNVHPAKIEVRFRHADEVWHAVQRAVRAAVTGLAPVAPMGGGFRALGGGGGPSGGSVAAGSGAAAAGRLAEPWPWARSDRPPPGGETGRIADAPIEAPSWPDVRFGRTTAGDGSERGAGDAQAEGVHPSLPPLRVIGQIAATYLVAEGPDGLYLIDQHAAHERIMYERYLARAAGEGVPTQALLTAHVVRLDAVQRAWVEANAPLLERIGLGVTLRDDDAVSVARVPEILAGVDPATVVRTILDSALDDVGAVERSLEARLIRAVCKRASIKGGQALSDIEARTLVHDLERCAAPLTCPHGRPTVVALSYPRLAMLFGRT